MTFYKYIHSGDYENLKKIIDRHPQKTHKLTRALICAVENDRDNIIELLMNKNINFHYNNYEILRICIKKNRLELINNILSRIDNIADLKINADLQLYEPVISMMIEKGWSYN